MNFSSSGPDAAADPPLIRPARRADLDALVTLENAAFANDRLSRRSLARLIGVRSAVVLVAEAGLRLAGAAVVLLRSYSRRARLYSLAVAAGFAGRGLGSALLAAAEQAAAARGAHWLTLEMREDNEPARRLYARRGYAGTGRSEAYYGDGAAALHLGKRLVGEAA